MSDAAGDAVSVASSPLTAAAELERRQKNIRAFFDAKLAKMPIVATTTTDEGQIIDWIPRPAEASDLPSVATLLGAPASVTQTPPKGSPGAGSDAPPSVLELEPHARGPAGTVPVVRFDVEAYLRRESNPPVDPPDVLRNLPPPAPEANGHYYVAWTSGGSSDPPFTGGGALINIWNGGGPPQLPVNQTSIAEVFVGRPKSRGPGLQAIEVGKIESRTLNGNSDAPFLFVHYTTDNYGAEGSDWIGGYNQNQAGWVQANTLWAPGLQFPFVSITDTLQISSRMDIIYGGGDGRWYVVFNGIILGWYPRCKNGDASFTCANSGYLFSTEGLRSRTADVEIFGEVGGETHSHYSTDMGSGRFAGEGLLRAAWFQDVGAYLAGAFFVPFGSGDPTLVTDNTCYSIAGPFFSPGHNWFYYGGPGSDWAWCL